MDDIHARAPVDRVAVRVVLFAGEHFDPRKKVLTNDSEMPLKIAGITKAMRLCPTFEDLTGKRFGRFTVLGIAEDFNGQWVVRCDCGRYSTRRKKSVLNPKNTQDRCEHCRHLVYLRREEHWRRTGRDVDINAL